MPIHMFRRNFYLGRGRSTIRSTVVLLAVATTGYVAGALVHNTLPPPNDPVAFARPVRAAETNLGDPLQAAPTLATVPAADESRWSNADRTQDPRECDLGKGISTACVFMD
jgi:hypothetical protein